MYVPITGEYYYAIKGEGSYYYDGEKNVQIHVNNKIENLTFLGRLGDYKYYDMDKAIARALEIMEK